MQLHSEAISDGSTIELTYCEPQCGGSNVSPDLTWSGAPEGTKSYAVTCFDPDAPTGSGWWHWIAFDIATAQTSLSAGQGPDAPMRQWRNDYGYVGYGGPCPPPGPAPSLPSRLRRPADGRRRPVRQKSPGPDRQSHRNPAGRQTPSRRMRQGPVRYAVFRPCRADRKKTS